MYNLSETQFNITPGVRWRIFKNKISNAITNVRCFFKPYNVVRIQNLPPTWTDRDDVLFHAMFQIFIDFIELEQPFVPEHIKATVKGRFTDQWVMSDYIERLYGPDRNTENENEHFKDWANKIYPVYKELLWMYKWYKDRKWDFSDQLSVTGQGYNWEIEKENHKKCDDMLHRIVAWRGHYWT